MIAKSHESSYGETMLSSYGSNGGSSGSYVPVPSPSNATDNGVSPKYETATIVLGVLLGCALVAVSVVASCYKCIRRHHGHRRLKEDESKTFNSSSRKINL